MPREVLGRLGGSDQLEQRLRPIVAAKLDHYAELTPAASDTLAAAYDGLFRQLTAIPAGSGGVAGTEDPASPIEVNPHGGWAVTLPVPEGVLGKLGGSAQVRALLGPILGAPPGPGSGLTPDASDKLASVYGTLIQHLEAVTGPERRS